jgi:hypothetical protein
MTDEEKLKSLPCELNIKDGHVYIQFGKHTFKAKIPENDGEARALFQTKQESISNDKAKELILGTDKEQANDKDLVEMNIKAETERMFDEVKSISKTLKPKNNAEYNEMLTQFKELVENVTKQRILDQMEEQEEQKTTKQPAVLERQMNSRNVLDQVMMSGSAPVR